MKRKVTAIIAAGGSGKRFTGNRDMKPKQYNTIFGKPVIVYSLTAFQKSRFINEIIVSAVPEYFDYIHRLSVIYGIKKLSKLTDGGKSRFLSVRNAFREITPDDNSMVIIHDAARPNITSGFIDDIISKAFIYKNVITAVRINSTIKKVLNNTVKETIDRKNLWEIQTPQIFDYKTLKLSYFKAFKTDYTDESSLVESVGFKVKIAEGSRSNIKITTAEDLKILKKIMRR